MERLKYDEKLCESSPCPKSENTIDLVEEEDSAAREEYVLHQAKINQDIQVYFMKYIFLCSNVSLEYEGISRFCDYTHTADTRVL